MKKRVVVTGAGGFIGRHALPELKRLGYEVYPVDRHDADLLNPAEQRKLIESIKPTHLLHLAWYTEHGKFWNAPENLEWTSASMALLQNFAQAGGKRAVIAGTCCEYEWPIHGTQDFAESSPRRPGLLYGVCKNALQEAITRAAPELRLSVAWGRVFFLYGPNETESRLIPAAILAMLRGKATDFTHGRQIRDFMHVEDVARGFALLLDSPAEGPMNIASGQAVTVGEILDRIAASIGRPELLKLGAKPAPADEPDRIVADTTRLRTELGFVPRYSLEQGLDAVIKWWEQKI